MAKPVALVPQSSGGKCPTCRKPAVQEHRPFCSRRCADIDLARWLNGGYVIGGSARDEADDSTLAGAPNPASKPPSNADDETA
jgi:uncharacterized protein